MTQGAAQVDEPLGDPQPWPAPGKLNLFLHVVGRRDDGYHLLQTIFQFIDLADEIRFWRRPAGTIERVGDLLNIPAERDLTVRAAQALARRRTDLAGVGIETRKRLPLHGGVGGGSSDAATVLVALNQLWGMKLSEDELAEIGGVLGADVPVFVRGRAAWAEGIGDRLTPVDLPEPVYVIVYPGAAVSTGEMFQAPELTRDSPAIRIADFLAVGGRNDFEPVVRRRFAPVAESLDWLGRFAPARLTGTGSCVYAAMPDEARAREVVAELPERWTGFVARGRNRSPLADRARVEAARSRTVR